MFRNWEKAEQFAQKIEVTLPGQSAQAGIRPKLYIILMISCMTLIMTLVKNNPVNNSNYEDVIREMRALLSREMVNALKIKKR